MDVRVVDRRSRDELIETINEHLEGKIKSFEFEDRVSEIDWRTGDETVHTVREFLWGLYDDAGNYTAATYMDKASWDFVQRLVLILESDAHIQTEERKLHRGFPVISGIVALVYAAAWWAIGAGAILLHPFILLRYFILRTVPRLIFKQAPPNSDALVPFERMTDILSLRRQIPCFVKKEYPAKSGKRKSAFFWAPRGISIGIHIALYPVWIVSLLILLLLIAPGTLLVLFFPESDWKYSVISDAQPSDS